MPAQPTIRRATPGEIAVVYAIDDDACTLYQDAGLPLDFAPDHPFVVAEHSRWAAAAHDGHVYFAEHPILGPVGLLVLGFVAGDPHVEQVSVRRVAMQQGIGRRLLAHAVHWAGDRPLWLTTYSHLPWNRSFYESAGFVSIPDQRCPAPIVEILEEQRRWLPAPDQRIAMRRDPGLRLG